MADTLQSALRERAGTRALLSWLVLVAVLYWFLGSSPLQLGTSLATGAIIGLADLLTEVYDLRSEVESLGLGLVGMVGGAALFAFDDSPRTVSAGLLLVGAWAVFDAVQILRHEGLYADDAGPRDGRDVYRDYVVRRVDETLRERPLTRRELADALDADEAAVDDALATLDERGLLVREGSELRTVPSSGDEQRTGLARIPGFLGDGLRRLARPVALEFER